MHSLLANACHFDLYSARVRGTCNSVAELLREGRALGAACKSVPGKCVLQVNRNDCGPSSFRSKFP